MKHFERRGFRESLDQVIASVARAYGFTGLPVSIPKKHIVDAENETQEHTLLIASLAGSTDTEEKYNVQSWGVLKSKGASRIVFAVHNPKHALAQAFVIKASLAVAEASGLKNVCVLISSVGDDESRRRYVRELGNFFKKNSKALADDFEDLPLQHDPDKAAALIAASQHALKDALPRTIDFLSEPSRKIMLETISLLETLGIPYELADRLPYTPFVNRELVFAVSGEDAHGVKHMIATGGRFESGKRRDVKKGDSNLVGIALTIPETLDARDISHTEKPAVFVVHVGEAARLKSFSLLDSLWRAHVALDQALLAESITAQTQLAQKSGARYITIIGQREALDGTAILKNAATQLQETLPMHQIISRLIRVK